jgi:hypothetical protein
VKASEGKQAISQMLLLLLWVFRCNEEVLGSSHFSPVTFSQKCRAEKKESLLYKDFGHEKYL